MVGSQIQQGTVESSQNAEYEEVRAVRSALDVIGGLRDEVLPIIDLDPDDQDELETELGVVELHLKSKRPKATTVRDSLVRVAVILGQATVVAGSVDTLARHLARIHELIPGI